MTSTLQQLKQRTDADATAAREAYAALLGKAADGTALNKIQADKLHGLCQQLSITAEQAAEDEKTLQRISELLEASSGLDARIKELNAEQAEIGDRWSIDAMVEARLKVNMDFGAGRERLAKIMRDHLDIARQRQELKQLQRNPRLFEAEQQETPGGAT